MDRSVGQIDEGFAIAAILQRYGWTYQEFGDQPAWLIDYITITMDVESRLQREQERKAQVNRTNR